MDNQEQKNSSKGLKHQWIDIEDDALVDRLVQLKVEGKFVADIGFDGGFVVKLEEILQDSRNYNQSTS